jgi:hypothetical protein
MFWSGSNAVRGPGAKAPTDSPRAKINPAGGGSGFGCWQIVTATLPASQSMPPSKRFCRIAGSAGRTCRIAGKTINSCVFLPLYRCLSSAGSSACWKKGQDFAENGVRSMDWAKLLSPYMATEALDLAQERVVGGVSEADSCVGSLNVVAGIGARDPFYKKFVANLRDAACRHDRQDQQNR